MFKVLIADDEPKIRQRLAQLIDWSEMGFEIAGFAENGKQALDFVHHNPVDLCLIDVCMPILNGLDLIRKMHEEDDQMLFIVVSGFDEFEYARTCVELGVQQYLLKPVSTAAMKAAVDGVREILLERNSHAREWENALKIANKSISILRREFLSKLAQGLLTKEEIREECELLQLSCDSNYGLLLMVSNESSIGSTVREQELYRLRLENKWKEQQGDELITAFDVYDNIMGLYRVSEPNAQKAEAFRKQYPDMAMYDGLRIEEIPQYYERWTNIVHDHTDPVALNVISLIEQYYGEETFDLSRVAQILHMSASYLGRLMRKQTGMTFNEYLNKTRIRIATTLLDHTQLKIYEISDRVGYSSQHYFCTAFKRIVGTSPTEYRNMSTRPGKTGN